MDTLQPYLKAIAADTILTIRRGFYYFGNTKVNIQRRMNKAISESHYYDPLWVAQLLVDNEAQEYVYPTQPSTVMETENETTNEGLFRLTREGETNIMVLNFASVKKPGGGFLNGKQAQEECLARTSTLYPSLLARPELYNDNAQVDDEYYFNSMTYSPGVLFIKDDVGNYIKPVEAAVMTVAAPNVSKIPAEEYNEDKLYGVLYDRIYAMLLIAMLRGHKTLLLGAWGCGVFRNDPTQIAEIFSDILWNRFDGCFKRVVFSVYDNRDGLPIYTPFEFEFGPTVRPPQEGDDISLGEFFGEA